MKFMSTVLQYDVIDLTYNGEVVFTGSLDECFQFIEEQDSIGYEIVNHY